MTRTWTRPRVQVFVLQEESGSCSFQGNNTYMPCSHTYTRVLMVMDIYRYSCVCVYTNVCFSVHNVHLCISGAITNRYHRRELLNKNTKMCVRLLRVKETQMVATLMGWLVLPRLEELDHSAMEGSRAIREKTNKQTNKNKTKHGLSEFTQCRLATHGV